MGIYVHIMGTIVADRIAQGILGKTRSAVLSLLFTRPDESMYVREIINEVGTGSGAVQRELEQLEQYGLIERSVSGKQVYYQAVPDHPLFRDLAMFLVKTTGIADVIRGALKDIEDQIDVARAFGRRSGKDVDKFQGFPYHTAVTGSPLLNDCGICLDCQVEHDFDQKTGNNLFVGKIVHAERLTENREPLMYHEEEY